MLLDIRKRRGVDTWYFNFNHDKKRHRGWLRPVSVMNRREAAAELKLLVADAVKGVRVTVRELDFHAIIELFAHINIDTADEYACLNGVRNEIEILF